MLRINLAHSFAGFERVVEGQETSQKSECLEMVSLDKVSPWMGFVSTRILKGVLW